MEKFSVREVVEQAVRTERLGYEFYTSMAKKFEGHDGLRKLFGTLAGKELVHEKTFQELEGMIGDDEPEGWDEVSEYLRTIVESEFFLARNRSLPNLDHVKTVEEAVKFAVGFEKETLLHFHALRDAVKEKDLVDEIINEERSHIMWLTRFKDTLGT
jgi:rubrerythrin